MKNKRFIFRIFIFHIVLVFVSLLNLAHGQNDIKNKVLPDGVEHWYRIKTTAEQPWFFQQMENIFNVMLSKNDKLPFGKSIAFLIGVSEYKYLSPQLPFVKNDIQDMREFLLSSGGFDEVYVAYGKIVHRDFIENYIKNIFFQSLRPEDRLLVYYAGHGDDAGGNTGYMQFHEARPNNFAGAQVLAIKDAETWCSESQIGHLLFIFDCCASGLAFTPRGGGDEIKQLLNTLSGNGSRAIITAGTAEQQTFEVPRPTGKGNGVFTRALLNALSKGMADKGKDGFMTIEEIYAQVKDQVATFAARYSKKLTPRLWPMEIEEFGGTFVFINSEAKAQGIQLASNYTNILGATPVARGETVATYGIIQLTAYISGEVFIDGVFVEKIESGDSKQYRDIRTGTHKVEIRTGTQIYGQNVMVMKGQVNSVTIQPPRIESIPQQPTTVTPPAEKTIKGMTLVLIPGGTFEMGDTFGEGSDDEKPVHSVNVSDFYMGRTEVTVGQYQNFCQATGRQMPEAPSWGWQESHPIVKVSWNDANEFCKWAGCRLSTEAEWEYAAREGGKKVKWSGTSTESLLGDYAWYSSNSGSKTHPVATKKPNALGLYDMSGNVWEWNSDWYDENYYQNSPRNNPKGPSSGKYRFLRGGSWYSNEGNCRSSDRLWLNPDNRIIDLGFRVARDSPL